MCVALCQGAAKHFVDMEAGAKRPNGVKDFDVWSFFAAIPGQQFPAAIRHRHFDFGPSRFGAEPAQPAKFSHIKDGGSTSSYAIYPWGWTQTRSKLCGVTWSEDGRTAPEP